MEHPALAMDERLLFVAWGWGVRIDELEKKQKIFCGGSVLGKLRWTV
jgi:hypothetical protein